MNFSAEGPISADWLSTKVSALNPPELINLKSISQETQKESATKKIRLTICNLCEENSALKEKIDQLNQETNSLKNSIFESAETIRTLNENKRSLESELLLLKVPKNESLFCNNSYSLNKSLVLRQQQQDNFGIRSGDVFDEQKMGIDQIYNGCPDQSGVILSQHQGMREESYNYESQEVLMRVFFNTLFYWISNCLCLWFKANLPTKTKKQNFEQNLLKNSGLTASMFDTIALRLIQFIFIDYNKELGLDREDGLNKKKQNNFLNIPIDSLHFFQDYPTTPATKTDENLLLDSFSLIKKHMNLLTAKRDTSPNPLESNLANSETKSKNEGKKSQCGKTLNNEKRRLFGSHLFPPGANNLYF